MISCALAEYNDILLVTGGRHAAIAWNGESFGHRGSTHEKGLLFIIAQYASGDELPATRALASFRPYEIFASARQTSVRPQTIAIRQSSAASPVPSVRLGKFSPVSKTSRAPSQYVDGPSGSPGSSILESDATSEPMRNSVVPKIAWNAVGNSLCLWRCCLRESGWGLACKDAAKARSRSCPQSRDNRSSVGVIASGERL